ncbi:MAG TPA: transcription termination/antitermination protein NusG [Acidimicrobiia bacterium]|jgi:transcriptional antiterminator NusG
MPDLIETTEMEETAAETAATETVETDVEEAPEAAVEETADTVGAPEAEQPDSPDDVAEISEVDTVEIEAVAAPQPEQPAEAAAEAVGDETGEVETDATETEEEARPPSPYDMPGDWYVIHSYSGYENKVKANLETRIQSMHMGDRIFEVHIPMEDVVEFKGGKKVTVPKKVFPGYILVRMTLDDDSWYAVRNTPGVTGFVAGNAQKPTPLSKREVERFLGVQEEEEKAKPRFRPEWEVGEQVRVVTGPFADFNGVIEDMNVDQQKVTVLVNIFGRDTPVELGFEDIQKS